MKSQIRSSRTGSETVLVNLELTSYFSLNETGTLVWEGLRAGKSLQEVRDELVERFEGPSDEIWNDIAGLTRQLLEQRFLAVAEGGDNRSSDSPRSR